MKKYKKLIILFALLLVLVIVLIVAQIYAKYLSSATGDTSVAIAKWNILVNNTSIRNNTDISSTITPVFPGNSNIASNIIAPTAEGYFDLNLNYTDADVTFQYTITTSVPNDSSVSDIVTTGYSVDGGQKIEFQNYNESITDTIPLTSQTRQRSIRIYVLWNDDSSTAQMSNTADTAATASGNPAKLNVNIAFTQLADGNTTNTNTNTNTNN